MFGVCLYPITPTCVFVCAAGILFDAGNINVLFVNQLSLLGQRDRNAFKCILPRFFAYLLVMWAVVDFTNSPGQLVCVYVIPFWSAYSMNANILMWVKWTQCWKQRRVSVCVWHWYRWKKCPKKNVQHGPKERTTGNECSMTERLIRKWHTNKMFEHIIEMIAAPGFIAHWQN